MRGRSTDYQEVDVQGLYDEVLDRKGLTPDEVDRSESIDIVGEILGDRTSLSEVDVKRASETLYFIYEETDEFPKVDGSSTEFSDYNDVDLVGQNHLEGFEAIQDGLVEDKRFCVNEATINQSIVMFEDQGSIKFEYAGYGDGWTDFDLSLYSSEG